MPFGSAGCVNGACLKSTIRATFGLVEQRGWASFEMCSTNRGTYREFRNAMGEKTSESKNHVSRLEASIEDFLCCLSLVQLEERAVPVLRDKGSYTARISCGELTWREEVGANQLCFRVPHWDFHGGLHLWLGEITQTERKCYSFSSIVALLIFITALSSCLLFMLPFYVLVFSVVRLFSTCSEQHRRSH